MTMLKGLNFVPAPKRRDDPIQIKRDKLITQLQQQRALAEDPNHIVTRLRWHKSDDGTRRLLERQKRVKPWWQTDLSGNTVLVLRYGAKILELEKGKPAIAIGAKTNLVKTIDAVIAAVAQGELDTAISATQSLGQKPRAKAA